MPLSRGSKINTRKLKWVGRKLLHIIHPDPTNLVAVVSLQNTMVIKEAARLHSAV